MVPPLLDEDLVFRGSPKRARQPLPANTPWALSLPRLSRVCHARADTSWGEDSVRAARASRRCCRTAMPSAAACQLRVHRPRYHRHIRRCSPLHQSPPKDTRASDRPASGREAQIEAFLGPAALHACSGMACALFRLCATTTLICGCQACDGLGLSLCRCQCVCLLEATWARGGWARSVPDGVRHHDHTIHSMKPIYIVCIKSRKHKAKPVPSPKSFQLLGVTAFLTLIACWRESAMKYGLSLPLFTSESCRKESMMQSTAASTTLMKQSPTP